MIEQHTGPSRFEAPPAGELSTESVRVQLARITACRTFANAPVLRRFLEHIVEYVLQGRTDQLKEYALGVDVFDRGSSFEPRVDTIVRVQARRLRSKLEEYYRTEGRSDPILIQVPKGHYVPDFRPAVGNADPLRVSEVVPDRTGEHLLDFDRAQGPGWNGEPETNSPVPAAQGRAVVPVKAPLRRTLWIGLGTGLPLGAMLMTVVGVPALWHRDPGARVIPSEVRPPAAEAEGTAAMRVGVALFENRTADPTLDPLGRLAAERMIGMVSGLTGVEVAPHAIEIAAGAPDDSAALIAASGVSLVVTGAYYGHTEKLEFQARVLEVATGRLLHAPEPVTSLRTRPTEALDRLEQKIAGAVAIHFDDFFGGLHAVSHPPTLEAYREYRAGLEIFQSDYHRTLVHLERAVERAPTFLLPLVIMHFAYGNLGEFKKVEAVLALMEDRSDRLTPAERLLIEFLRADWEGRRAQAFRVLEDLEGLVPESLGVNHNLVQQAVMLNRPRTAVHAYGRHTSSERSLRHSIGTYRLSSLTAALHTLGEHGRELEEIKLAQQYAPGVLLFMEAEALALAALGRVSDVTRVIDRSLSIGPTAGWSAFTPGRLMEHASRELRAHGYPEASLEIAARAVDWYRDRPDHGAAGQAHRAGLARALYLAERWEEADALFSVLAAEEPAELAYIGYLGNIAARRGDLARARDLSEKLGSTSERLVVTRGRSFYFGAVAAYERAGIAAQLGERQRAVDLLRHAFTQGFPHGPHIHSSPDFETLRDYEPYRELVRPDDGA